MDNLTTLLNKKQYDLVLELSKGNDDPEVLFCRISAFLNLGKADEAMDLVEKKRNILWEASPVKCLKANFELRFILNEYDEAYKDADYFKSLPYVSQEVEEYLRTLDESIRFSERQSSIKTNYTDEEIEEILLGNGDEYEKISILTSFNDAKVIYHSQKIVKMISLSNSNIVKTYGLMLLVKAKYPKEISFSKNGVDYKIMPAKEILPYERKEAKYLLSMIQKEMKDPSLYNISKNILNNYMFEEFPANPFKEKDLNVYFLALVNISLGYLHSKTNLNPLFEKYNVKQEDAAKISDSISETLNKAEQIKV